MRRALILLAALAIGVAPLHAGATTVPTLTLSQQAKKADVIVRATVGTPAEVTEGELTWRVYPLTITETVAGDPATLPQREGRPALYVLSGLDEAPELRAGQDAFLLLYARRLDNPVVGFAQGFYPIENGRVTRPADAASATNPGPGTSATPATSVPTGATPSPTAPGASAATTPTAGASASPTASPPSGTTATGTTTTPATPPAPGTTTAAPGAATTPTTPSTATSSGAAATTTPTAAAPTTGTAAPAAAPASATPAASTPPASDPNAFPTDPARFRDALRAAREAR